VSDPIAILSTGLVTSVGLSAQASCAAIRAGVTNPTETRYIDSRGEWIMAHQVPLDEPWSGFDKLARMAVMVIQESLAARDRADWSRIPLLLCVAERERPGRVDGLDDGLLPQIQQLVGLAFHAGSMIVPDGRVSFGVALLEARRLLAQSDVLAVLIVAVDSFICRSSILAYERAGRILTPENSNGFIPGEGAGALLVGRPSVGRRLLCTGLGFGTETAHIESTEPLRADGLTDAVRDALQDAQCGLEDVDFRIVDVSGEQYYFKEASLTLSRVLRARKEQFDIWHPAECIGESGAVAGPASIAVAYAACSKNYAPGPNILLHAANDAGQRMAAIVRYLEVA
jgi:3-oxoacyl-[acyl-carrier-protein] synthase-1